MCSMIAMEENKAWMQPFHETTGAETSGRLQSTYFEDYWSDMADRDFVPYHRVYPNVSFTANNGGAYKRTTLLVGEDCGPPPSKRQKAEDPPAASCAAPATEFVLAQAIQESSPEDDHWKPLASNSMNTQPSSWKETSMHEGIITPEESVVSDQKVQADIWAKAMTAEAKKSVLKKGSRRSSTGSSSKKKPAMEKGAKAAEKKKEESGDLDKEVCLGKDFVPGNWDVVCGRGKNWLEYVANRRFRILVAVHLREYFETISRIRKSQVIDSIVHAILNAGGQGFVKKKYAMTPAERRRSTSSYASFCTCATAADEGVWYRITLKEAREKVSHALRDCLMDPQNEQLKWSLEKRAEKLREAQNNVFKSLELMY